jgi:hypothetical protein
MDIFRLTYFVAQKHEEDKWKCSDRFEIFGSAEAISHIWLNLTQIGKDYDGSFPRFIEVISKDGNVVDMTYGVRGMYAQTTNTFK